MANHSDNAERKRIQAVLKEYLDRLAELRREHDALLKEFIRALEEEKEREVRTSLTS